MGGDPGERRGPSSKISRAGLEAPTRAETTTPSKWRVRSRRSRRAGRVESQLLTTRSFRPARAEGLEDLEDLRIEAPALLPVEVGDELVEEPLRQVPAADPRGRPPGRSSARSRAPRRRRPSAPRPAPAGAATTPHVPRRAAQDGLVRGGDAPAAERPAVDASRRAGRPRGACSPRRGRPPSSSSGHHLPAVDDDRLAGDVPRVVRRRATRRGRRPRPGRGPRPSGAIFPAAAKASSSVSPIALP